MILPQARYRLPLVLVAFASIAHARDQPADAVRVEFADTANVPNVRYRMKLAIEYDGVPKPFVVRLKMDAGGTGVGQAITAEAVLKASGGWVYTREEHTLLVAGWKDPKTGRFHRAKGITATTDDMPTMYLPKITRPGGKL